MQIMVGVKMHEQVMHTLKQLAQEGHTVICSIHQPRSSIYAMFDDLVLLSEGQLIYSGEPCAVSALIFGIIWLGRIVAAYGKQVADGSTAKNDAQTWFWLSCA